jgi:hypothetical protein
MKLVENWTLLQILIFIMAVVSVLVFSFEDDYPTPSSAEARSYISMSWTSSQVTQQPFGQSLIKRLAGLPTTVQPAGTSRVTTAPMPITAPRPMTNGCPGLP